MKRVFAILLCCVLVGYVVYTLVHVPAGTRPHESNNDVLPKSPSLGNPQDTAMNVRIDLGNWTQKTLNDVIRSAPHQQANAGERIATISEKFLGTPYEANTLTGDAETPEQFTINLAGLDCFTYLDYVEAARNTDSYDAFVSSVLSIRYKDGLADFQNRNHFFSDWSEYNQVRDMTREIGGDAAVSVEKQLNQKEDGTLFLEGIPIVVRTITYIPTTAITDTILEKLQTGDYIGIYTDIDGLDVTHTGILIKKDNAPYLRHASSREGIQRVLDDPLLEYLKNKPGITVYRPY